MKSYINQIIDVCVAMRNYGVVLYGAGRQGKDTLETLEKENFQVKAVADLQVGKECGNFLAVSLSDLCGMANHEVCIMTPHMKLPDIKKKLENAFDIVLDYSIIAWMKYYVPHNVEGMSYSGCFPFNHYESPYSGVKHSIDRNYCVEETVRDIELNGENQSALWREIKKYYIDFFDVLNKFGNKIRYQTDNGWFSLADAALLHSILRKYKPENIIEIGSGFSTCVMLDTNEYWLGNEIRITSIEPYPERLLSNIKEKDKVVLHIKKEQVQNIPIEAFEGLGADDILFIDSSHVAKVGGDIPFIFFDILPRLKKGVLIHIHDIFYPFTYPENWRMEGRAYNEAFILRALLMNSQQYEILFFNDMMLKKYKTDYAEIWNNMEQMSGGSIWLIKK